MASQGQIRKQRVHPVHTSCCTSQTTSPVGKVTSVDIFTIQVSWGATAMHASHPVQRSGQIFAIVRDFRVGVAGGMRIVYRSGDPFVN
jgi:hypothetical protein